MSGNEFGIDQDTISGFLDEAGKHVATLNERLLALEQGQIGPEGVAEMFRAAHSLKGAAGFLKLTDIANVTHLMESVLDLIRHGKMTFSDQVIAALFHSFDTLSSLMAEVATGNSGQVDIRTSLTLLEAVLAGTAAPAPTPAAAAAAAPLPKPAQDPLLAFAEAPTGPPPPAYDPAGTHLGALPDWLQGRLDEEDVCESMFARGNGQQLVALRWDAGALLRFSRGPQAAMETLARSLTIRRMVQIIGGPEDLWAPLREYQLGIGIYGFCDGDAATVLPTLEVPAGQAWVLKEGGHAPLALEIGRDPATESGRHERLVIKADMVKHRPMWISTTEETLAELDAALLGLEREPGEPALVDQVFRHLHSLKGASASMGLDEIARIAHKGESVLAAVRDCRLRLDQPLMSELFACKDMIQACTERVEKGEAESPDTSALDAALGKRLSSIALDQPVLPRWMPNDEELNQARAAAGPRPLWTLRLVLTSTASLADLRYGMILTNLGKIATIHLSRPSLRELERGIDSPPSLCALFSSEAPLRELIDAISCDHIRDWAIDPLPAGKPAANAAGGATVAPGAGAGEARQGTAASAAAVDTVRVDTSRLDHLLNTAGELAITKARLTQQVDTLTRLLDGIDIRSLEGLAKGNGAATRLLAGISNLRRAQEEIRLTRETTQELHRHTSAMQHSVMQSRMVPIGPLFQRFHRLVRDLCKERGREAKLITTGDATELDKKLIDEIGDPLTHLIRNGIDHGMESPEERLAAGKPRQGSVHLEAFHQGSMICIRVRDDGRGLAVDRIKAKAIERGLVTAEAAERMGSEEIYQFIFLPGFSTAAQVTSISGRGVGMDIVKSKVLALKGKIDITSQPGRGAVFTISLPLTLAMIDSLLVRIGDARFAFPLDCVREIVEIHDEEVRSVEGKGRVIFLRDQVISLLDLHKVMGIVPLSECSGVVRAVITKGGTETLAIAVNQVIGDEEIVVKPLGQQFSRVRGLSGATVLGDGGVALILDIHGIHDISTAKRASKIPVGATP
jgi:two-component system chemotaxis sensor kinase CheA